ncbi:MAG: hypothetical protein KTR30_14400 [Saprospiraceae bacterium]|nr:hypothetical protein [Saprospiraceae bacterium]
MVKEGRNDHWYLEIARQKLEHKLGWGKVDEWSSEDFQTLSEAILASTDLSLSITTLKRLVGRVNYNATPNPTTLNAIARFLGYDNWRAFKQAFNTPPPAKKTEKTITAPVAKTAPPTPSVPAQKPRKWLTFVLPAAVLVLIMIIAIASQKGSQSAPLSKAAKEQVSFSTNPVADGIPNTVVFNYDLKDISGKVFEIQQSWDERKRFVIDPLEKEVTSTYYYPGYYRAKIVVDDQIIKEHDLFVPSNGWMAAIESGPMPRYILTSEWQQSPFLSVDNSVTETLHGEAVIPNLAYYLVQDFGDLRSTDFRLQTQLRHTFQDGKAACQYSSITINCTRGFIRIPLSAAGCVGELKARFNGLTIDGKKTNLSGLAHQGIEWQKIDLQMTDQVFRVKVNDQDVLKGKLPADPGRIVGIRYKFEGAGEVNELRVWDHQKDLVVNEQFGK